MGVRRVCIACWMVVLSATGASLVRADIVYNSIPSPQPYNLPSLGYQASQTAEFGDDIQLAGTNRQLTSVTVGMSDWARKSDYLDGNNQPLPGYGHVTMDANGFSWPLTVSLYSVDHSGPNPAVGVLIAQKTVTASIPWRPENNPGDNSVWVAPDNNKYGGIFSTVSFDFSADGITLPNDVIASLAYNTNTWGYNPTGLPGPYESLNFALASHPDEPTVGTDAEPDALFWNTMTATNYTDGGAGGVGTFRRDTAWFPYTPALELSVVPEAGAFWLGAVVCGVVGFGYGGRALRRKSRASRESSV